MFTPCLTAISNAVFSPPLLTVGAADTMATMAMMLNKIKVFIFVSKYSFKDMILTTSESIAVSCFIPHYI